MTLVGIILLIVAVVGGYYLYKNRPGQTQVASGVSLKQIQNQKEVEKRDSIDLNIRHIDKGAVIHLNHVGPDMLDLDLQILEKNLIKEGSYRWYEYACESGSDKYYLTVEEDDSLDISLTLAAPKLSDLGLAENDLDTLRKGRLKSLRYRGQEFEYDEGGRAEFCRNGNELSAEPHSFWEYCNEDESEFLSVTTYDGEEFEFFWSVPVKENQVTVYSIGNS